MKLKDLKINPSEQGTFEWRKARLGKATSTRIADLMGRGRGKDELFGKTAIAVMAEMAGERMLDEELLTDEEKFYEWSDRQCRENNAMRFGTTYEPMARILYTAEVGKQVIEVGLTEHPTVKNLAGSPDGLIVDSKREVVGVIEIKCPATTKTFVQYLWEVRDGETLKAVNPGYYWQCQNNMNVTGAKYCDFVAYSPDLKRIHIARVERNEDDITAINNRMAEVETYINQKTA